MVKNVLKFSKKLVLKFFFVLLGPMLVPVLYVVRPTTESCLKS